MGSAVYRGHLDIFSIENHSIDGKDGQLKPRVLCRRWGYWLRAVKELRDDWRRRRRRPRHRHRHGPHREVQPQQAVPLQAL